MEIGITKIGICLGLPWIFNTLVNLSNNVKWTPDESMKHVAASYTSAIGLTLLFILGNSFRVDSAFAYWSLVIGVVFIVISVTLIIIDI